MTPTPGVVVCGSEIEQNQRNRANKNSAPLHKAKLFMEAHQKHKHNVERSARPHAGAWVQSEHLVDFNAFETISAAAYLRESAQANRTVFAQSNCDMLFIMEPVDHGWEIEIVTATHPAEILKSFICNKIEESGFNNVTVF